MRAMMLNLKGCQIFAYDHTINAPPRRGQNIQYFKTGVGFGENLKPLSQIIAENDHKNTGIDYLKVKYKEFKNQINEMKLYYYYYYYKDYHYYYY